MEHGMERAGGFEPPLWPHLAKRSMVSNPPLPVHARSPYLDPLGHEFPYTFNVHIHTHLHRCYMVRNIHSNPETKQSIERSTDQALNSSLTLT